MRKFVFIDPSIVTVQHELEAIFKISSCRRHINCLLIRNVKLLLNNFTSVGTNYITEALVPLRIMNIVPESLCAQS